MSLSLSAADMARLEDASRAFLYPLAAPTAADWLAGAGALVRDLLGADLLYTTTPLPAFTSFSPDAPDFARAVHRILREADAAGLHFDDALLKAWYTYGTEEVTTMGSLRQRLEPLGFQLEESAFFAAACAPYGLADLASLHLKAHGDASVVVLGRRGLRFGDDVRTVLRLLLPSFRAGVEALARAPAPHLALDRLTEPLALLDADGRERHRNAALVSLLEAEPERAAVEVALWQLGRDVRRLAFPRRMESAAPPPPMQREVATGRARYTLSASILPPGAFGPGEAALLSIERTVIARPLSPAEVQARHGLSAREAEVALLVAEGLTNAQIADRLFVAAGTVKRHVEGVLAKLGVPARSAVAARLLSGDAQGA